MVWIEASKALFLPYNIGHLTGFGSSLDTRALYESRAESRKTEWGKGLLLSSGYEFLQTEKWALDIQTQLLMASLSREGLDNLEGTSFTLSIGFTLY